MQIDEIKDQICDVCHNVAVGMGCSKRWKCKCTFG